MATWTQEQDYSRISQTQGSKYIYSKLPCINNYFSHLHRNNDHIVNRSGKDLLLLCGSLGLYIVNGRIRGDTLWRYTFCSPLGNRTVDYMKTDIDPSSLRAFTVRELTPLSDHSQITVYLKVTKTNISTQTSNVPYQKTIHRVPVSNKQSKKYKCC